MKKLKCLPLLLLLFALSGCSLAQPENQDNAENGDIFVGVYVVFGERSLDRTGWVEYGQGMDIETGFGSFALPNEVLFATYDAETNRWNFPGVDGHCAFATDAGDYATGYDGLQNVHIAYGNNACTKLEGTVYIEKSDGDYFATYYNVYETKDGRIYMDGTGNSMSSPASSGGAMSTSHENTYSENGKVVETYEFEVKVDIEAVVPTTSLILVQYDENDVELSREELSLEEQHITPSPDTAWMVVVETDKEGNLHRTAYEPPVDEDDWVAHNFYLPQEDGSIQIYTLFFDVV